ncbi:uncharacterized protein LOC125497976 [Beta vulgaris subsp. vulgaris]|uniref:uncharacterized protein LOC125497976 n=1 Tax=Beta vulgaris subsp. vulgaris TaxID=3555 RepID=UPI0020366B26|nr:uncharacterized protein LOC125497976 [Beta vulgaris subsp. vulgaris]
MDEYQFQCLSTPTSHTSSDPDTTGLNALTVPSKKTKRAGPPEGTNSEFDSSFDQEVYCQLFAKAVLCHAYPLRIVEHEKLRKLHSYLNPKVRHISRNTILRYCALENEKLKLNSNDTNR